MFDTLTYVKGGAVLRMLEQWLGAERFRDGIRRYLAKHAYGNTETHDLWDALEEETGEPVRRIMDAWIFQPGYPAISVDLDGDRVRFSQRRFLPSKDDDDTTWPVPLMVRQVSGDQERVDRILIEADGAELELLAPDAVVVANAGSASFVRVWYDDELRRAIVVAAMDVLSPIERYSLVDDAWAAVVAGTASAGSFLDLVAGVRRTRPTSGCGSRSSAGSAGSTGSSRASRASACGRSCATSCGRRSRGSAGTPRRMSPTSPGRSAASSCSPSPSWAPIRRPSRSAASWSSRARAIRSSCRPPWKRWPRRGPQDDLDRYWQRYRARHHAAGGGALPVRDVAVPR